MLIATGRPSEVGTESGPRACPSHALRVAGATATHDGDVATGGGSGTQVTPTMPREGWQPQDWLPAQQKNREGEEEGGDGELDSHSNRLGLVGGCTQGVEQEEGLAARGSVEKERG